MLPPGALLNTNYMYWATSLIYMFFFLKCFVSITITKTLLLIPPCQEMMSQHSKTSCCTMVDRVSPPTKELWRSNREVNRGKSRQIAANRGIFHPEKNGDHFFEKSRRIASKRAFQKTMAITLEVKFEPFLACTIFVVA